MFPILPQLAFNHKKTHETENRYNEYFEVIQCLLLMDSRSHILSAPDKEPAITVSSELLNFTASTGLV